MVRWRWPSGSSSSSRSRRPAPPLLSARWLVAGVGRGDPDLRGLPARRAAGGHASRHGDWRRATSCSSLALIVCAGVALAAGCAGAGRRAIRRAALLAPGRGAMACWRGRRSADRRAASPSRPAPPASVDERWQEFKAPPSDGRRGRQQDDVFEPPAEPPRAKAATSSGGCAGRPRDRARGRASARERSSTGGPTRHARRLRPRRPLPVLRDAGRIRPVGLALLAGCSRSSLIVAVVRSLREPTGAAALDRGCGGRPGDLHRIRGVEWVWEMAAIAAVVLALGAVIVAGRDDAPHVAAVPEPASPCCSLARCWRCSPSPRSARSPCRWPAPSRPRQQSSGRLRRPPRGRTRAQPDGRAAAALRRDAAPAARTRPRGGGSAQRRGVRSARGDAGGADELAHLARARAHRGKRGRATSAVRALREARRLNPRSTMFAK